MPTLEQAREDAREGHEDQVGAAQVREQRGGGRDEAPGRGRQQDDLLTPDPGRDKRPVTEELRGQAELRDQRSCWGDARVGGLGPPSSELPSGVTPCHTPLRRRPRVRAHGSVSLSFPIAPRALTRMHPQTPGPQVSQLRLPLGASPHRNSPGGPLPRALQPSAGGGQAVTGPPGGHPRSESGSSPRRSC